MNLAASFLRSHVGRRTTDESDTSSFGGAGGVIVALVAVVAYAVALPV